MSSGDAEPPTAAPETSTFTVTELCRVVEQQVQQAFPDEVWVQGSISGLTRSNNGHVYFDLIDGSDQVGRSTGAVLPVALFAQTRNLVNRILRRAGGIRMHDGIEIRIRGRVAYYPPQGRVQLIMSLIDPQFTLGQMVAARTDLLERLADEDLLERNGRLDLPRAPLRVALVTSDGSAAYHDVVDQLLGSGHPFSVTLIDSRVQGIEAVETLTAAVSAADGLDVDVVVIARGGGARADLVAFDHERVARAVAGCRHPVIVGIGHETDRSVTDEVAHTSVKTPTAAAVVLIDAVTDFHDRVEHATGRLAALTSLHLDAATERLVGCGNRLIGAATRIVEGQRVELRHAGRRLTLAPAHLAKDAERRLELDSARLAALDPQAALRRGWTITRTADGRLVRSVADAGPETELRTTTMDGTIASRVTGTAADDPT